MASYLAIQAVEGELSILKREMTRGVSYAAALVQAMMACDKERSHALYGDPRYRDLDYSGTDSRVTIYTIPTELHGASAATLQTAISYSVRYGLLRHNNQELLRRNIPVGESTISSTNDPGEGSATTPDGGLNNSNINVWLSHILPYCYPLTVQRESKFQKTDECRCAQRDHSLGSYRHRDHDWCGTVAEAFIENFNSDSDNEEPLRYVSSKADLVVNSLSLEVSAIISAMASDGS
ncbi:hypothetical protein V1520DRAFT_394124 [Lipomyces starkeyi]|uniref:Uncharacterized protein n=1 Tax=Lipomyces starkeyi NRRL Y-11557 TaxID=675824 RepID=A0A1E3PVW9_LIPST|nr:hypothetical protein LIPSTDRAFT_6768 [Lipomyces starkeyi NRRL Y-11557]